MESEGNCEVASSFYAFGLEQSSRLGKPTTRGKPQTIAFLSEIDNYLFARKWGDNELLSEEISIRSH